MKLYPSCDHHDFRNINCVNSYLMVSLPDRSNFLEVNKVIKEIEYKSEWWPIFSCWIVASFSTMGSLFFSEVMAFTPCVLCWYQRIAMYPLTIIFLIGAFQPVKYAIRFSLPLVLVGWMIALYHNLLYYEIIPESASPCLEGVSCSTVYINWLGFITIPLLSLFSFSILFTILLILNRSCSHEK